MADFVYKNEYLDKYVSELTSRVVADTGIASDKYHLGKIILQSLKDDPDFMMQTDGGTGLSETNGSVLKRSIQCATSFRNMGLKTGDVMILMAPNHLDQAIPFYAALYLGIVIAPVDRTFGVYELKSTFNIDKPKIIFCQSEKVQDVQKAIELLQLDAKVVSFDKCPNALSFPEMLETYGDNINVQDFKAADFDPEETIALLISTSGTTGLPKSAALTYKNIVTNGSCICSFSTKFPSPTRASLLVAPLQWLSSLLNYIFSPVFKFVRIQSSMPLNLEHVCDLIKTYEPTFMIISPTMMTTLLKVAEKVKCNFSSFEVILIGGSAVPQNLIQELKRLMPKALVTDTYGMSELGCITFYSLGTVPGSCGKRYDHIQYKLVNIETGEEITEPNKCGELWLKGLGDFKGYYNNPEATAEVLTKDRWFMTGDMMYRDENWNYYFVERIKLLMKYRNHQVVVLAPRLIPQPERARVEVTLKPSGCVSSIVDLICRFPSDDIKISPVELETVIRQHTGVADVAVTGVPDAEYGDLPIACVVPRTGAVLSAQEIKDLVKEKLTDSKQLRGGVIFLKELPLTTSTKVHRRKLKEIVLARTKDQLTV